MDQNDLNEIGKFLESKGITSLKNHKKCFRQVRKLAVPSEKNGDYVLNCRSTPHIPEGLEGPGEMSGEQITSRFKGTIRISKDVETGKKQLSSLLSLHRDPNQLDESIEWTELLQILEKEQKVVGTAHIADFLEDHPEYLPDELKQPAREGVLYFIGSLYSDWSANCLFGRYLNLERGKLVSRHEELGDRPAFYGEYIVLINKPTKK